MKTDLFRFKKKQSFPLYSIWGGYFFYFLIFFFFSFIVIKLGYKKTIECFCFQLGEEDGKAKAAPMKMKVQFMLQVPQDDIMSPALLFRVKKRWDLF